MADLTTINVRLETEDGKEFASFRCQMGSDRLLRELRVYAIHAVTDGSDISYRLETEVIGAINFMANDPHGLLGLWGFADGAHVEVVTRRGVLIPLALAKGWTVVDLAELLGDIDGLPETGEPC